MKQKRSTEFWLGVRDELPILVGVIPFGLIYGVSALGAHLSAAVAQAMSSVIFAGSSQFISAQLIGQGVPALVVILTAAIVNLRHVLYSASVAGYTQQLPQPWKWLLAYLLTDEAYAVTITHYRSPGELTHRHWYFFGAGLALWTSWQLSTAAGVFLGGQIPSQWSLDFTLSLTFIGFVMPALRDRASIATAIVAAVGSVAAFRLPDKLGLVVAIVLAITAGVVIDQRREKAS